MILIAFFVLVYAAIGAIAWRRPLLARLAVREAVREQAEVSAEMRVAAQAFGANPVVGQAEEARAARPRARRKRR